MRQKLLPASVLAFLLISGLLTWVASAQTPSGVAGTASAASPSVRLVFERGSSKQTTIGVAGGYRLSNIMVSNDAEIYLANGDGTGLRKLASGAQPAFSPDGSKIAFVRMRGGSAELKVINADGNGLRRLPLPVSPAFPAWSPDGKQIAFSAVEGGKNPGMSQVYVVDENGSGLRQVTKDGGAFPAWSPDGKQVVFATPKSGVEGGLWVIHDDGSGLKELANLKRECAFPAWSPDGSKIAFSAILDGAAALYVMNADGSEVRKLVSDPKGEMRFPAWYPDGRSIAFTVSAHDVEGDKHRMTPSYRHRIWVVNVESGKVRQLIGDSASDVSVAPGGGL